MTVIRRRDVIGLHDCDGKYLELWGLGETDTLDEVDKRMEKLCSESIGWFEMKKAQDGRNSTCDRVKDLTGSP
jgi:hypothetical protein